MKLTKGQWLSIAGFFATIAIISTTLFFSTSQGQISPFDPVVPDTTQINTANLVNNAQTDSLLSMEESNQPLSSPSSIQPISSFDSLFQREAALIGWDWYILAAIAHHESRFTPHAIGPAGAAGLMGIMPATGRKFGYTRKQLLVPENNIRSGAKTLALFEKHYLEIEDKEQRQKFALAAYATGNTHIDDARKLAHKYGKDPHVWDDCVEEYLKLLAQKKYYRDPVVKYGRVRGHIVAQFVKDIYDLATRYRQQQLAQ